MVKIRERDEIILTSGQEALVVSVLADDEEFSVFISNTSETKIIKRKDIRSIIQYEEIPIE